MGFFQRLSVRRKVRWLVMLAVTLALMASIVLQAFGEFHSFRRNLESHVAVLAETLARSSAPTLVAGDSVQAESLISALAVDEYIAEAALISGNAEVLAGRTFSGASVLNDVRGMIASGRNDIHFPDGGSFSWYEGLSYLNQVSIIRYQGTEVGYVYLRSSMAGLYESLLKYALASVAALILSALVGFGLSYRLEPLVTQPIIGLRDVTKRVADERNFDLRATKDGDDEIGELVDGFNLMLDQLGERDLRRARLEQQLEARSTSLEDANSELTLAMVEMREAKDRAEAASIAKSEFLARMSHEIRTPMNGVLGLSELLANSPGLTGKQQRFVNMIHQSGESLLMIINDILDFSKIEAGRLEVANEPFDVVSTVTETVDLLSERAFAKGLELVADMPTETLVTGKGDELRLKQVLTNLLGNAIKFTEAGEVIARVRSKSNFSGEPVVRIEIEDTGIGIDTAKTEEIFAAFSQEDGSTTRRFGGTGLGLAISRQLMELMGGVIGVESSKGNGSIFWLELPAVAEQERVERDLESLHAKAALIVDDNSTSRRTLARMLDNWGLQVDQAGSGREALRTFEGSVSQGGYDIILLDITMPGLNGFDVARRLSKAAGDKQPKILLMGSMMLAESTLAGSSVMVGGVINKPVSANALFEALSRLFDDEQDMPDGTDGVFGSTSTLIANLGLNILLVEDNPVNQAVASNVLQQLGCRYTVANNGMEGVELYKKHRFDLVLMDCQMPVMDGYQATGEIRQYEEGGNRGRTPIVALTANAHQSERHKCINAGMDEYVSKPFSMTDLRSALELCTGQEDCGGATTIVEDSNMDTNDTVAAVSASTAIDRDALDRMIDMQGAGIPGFLEMLVAAYCDSAPGIANDLLAAIDKGDAPNIKLFAHSLKSSSRNVGAETLGELCAALESMGDAGDVAGALARQDEFNTAFAAVMNELTVLSGQDDGGLDAASSVERGDIAHTTD